MRKEKEERIKPIQSEALPILSLEETLVVVREMEEEARIDEIIKRQDAEAKAVKVS